MTQDVHWINSNREDISENMTHLDLLPPLINQTNLRGFSYKAPPCNIYILKIWYQNTSFANQNQMQFRLDNSMISLKRIDIESVIWPG